MKTKLALRMGTAFAVGWAAGSAIVAVSRAWRAHRVLNRWLEELPEEQVMVLTDGEHEGHGMPDLGVH